MLSLKEKALLSQYTLVFLLIFLLYSFLCLFSFLFIFIFIFPSLMLHASCYELKFLESDDRTTLVLSNTRELDRELFYKLVYLI